MKNLGMKMGKLQSTAPTLSERVATFPEDVTHRSLKDWLIE
jgi:hypothetical protein